MEFLGLYVDRMVLVWLVPGVPALLLGANLLYNRYAKNRRRERYEGKRARNIAHERAWTLVRGRKANKRITYRPDDL